MAGRLGGFLALDDHAAADRITAAQLPSQALFIPCPPVTRGQEVSADAMAAPACCVTEAKAYLLHPQNAVLEALLWDAR